MATQQLNHDDTDTVIDGRFDDVSEIEMENDDELATILEQIGSDRGDVVYTLNIYRLPPTGKKIWLYECDATEPQKEKLRDEYGGGKFEFWLRKNNRIFARPKVLIEAPRNIKNNSNNNEGARHENNMHQADIISLIQAANKSVLEAVAKLVAPTQSVESPFDQMKSMVSLMNEMKSFTTNESQETDPFKNIKEVLELKKLFGGSGEGETNNADVLMAAIEHIGGPLSEMTKNAAPASLKSGQKNRPVKQQAPQPTPTKQDDEMNGLKMGIKLMVSAAKRNDDPAPYVDIILERMEPEQVQVFLTDENAMDLLITVNPEVANHPKWFEELSKLLNEKLFVDENGEEHHEAQENIHAPATE
jgi:hypothetical protein